MRIIYIKDTGKYGRGIYAACDIKKGEFIEEAPLIVIPKDEWKQMRKSILSNYVFQWGEHKAIALGYGSLYNHSYTPNARYHTNVDNCTILFYAFSDIKTGDEITVNYNGDPYDNSPLWFDVID
ncbi:hypothetical protein SAMN04487897_14413 [Paenibacillus sp. yr247]|uniref:SET domain-containing protein n=1 Tax=Paenibacillus sp. yr247 TaxID=1761880 RepID=UPI0008908EA3|nr:SET domain-containing protein [Paenibacillus sp. yr247]SDP18714.1 hypothetical protein SAMN04487897_14413 [Paenibacillus sp. yr247]